MAEDSFNQALQAGLEQARKDSLYRSRRTLLPQGGPRVQMNGRSLLNFCSNDYLGLKDHPDICKAFKAGVDRYGAGSGASSLVTGYTVAHAALEEELAEFVGRERALLCSTGYMANLGVATSLAGRGDTIIEDRLNHASLIDGARLSGARLKRYQHADLRSFQQHLQQAGGMVLVMTDSLFSMDGDEAPLAGLAQQCRNNDATLMVDDAHGIGVMGPSGSGTLAARGLDMAAVPVLVGTLGKAFGTFGAFIAGSEFLIDTLVQKARAYIYTTALPPALAQAGRAALAVVKDSDHRREHLQQLIRQLREGGRQLGLNFIESKTPIQPLLVGDPKQALELSNQLEQRGILVTAIRPPTVPAGTSRLRITLSAGHGKEDVELLLEALDKCRVN